MNHKSKKILTIILFLILINNCDSKFKGGIIQQSNNNIIMETPQNNNKMLSKSMTHEIPNINIDEIKNLIELLKTDNTTERNRVVSKLLEISKESLDKKKSITIRLIYETKKMCETDDVMIVDTDFYKLNAMSNILAEFQNMESLDILIDCSNHSTVMAGNSATDYATMPAIVEFGDKAIPILKKKMSNSRKEIKCQIASILSLIGSSEAEITLRKALKLETDETVSNCLNRNIKSFDNNKF